ncbi:hypothetical protein H5410_027703 [Solanum commersonii]|uniref:Uncharacterized protein n=1 Tax=Solanum commersonii TaxID=4109 RepID=A0A9J5YZX2_SOLCO|nr:hypothetical protein H5410_027703 [Solanum commersonii]
MARLITEERRVLTGSLHTIPHSSVHQPSQVWTGWLETRGDSEEIVRSSMLPMQPLSGAPFLSGRSP